MARMFRRSEDGALLCDACLEGGEEMVSAQLEPRHFPGTYHKLTCSRCGAAGGVAEMVRRFPRLAG